MAKKYGCPHCKYTGDDEVGFTSDEVLLGTASLYGFDEEGKPIYSGDTEVDWDSQGIDPDVTEPFHCLNCQKKFAKPVLIEVPDE